MAIEGIPVECKCGNAFRVKAAAAGKKVRCPQCKTPCMVVAPIEVPDPLPKLKPPEQEPAFVPTSPDSPGTEAVSEVPDILVSPYTPPKSTAPLETGTLDNQSTSPPLNDYKSLRLVSKVYHTLALAIAAIWAIGMVVGLIVGLFVAVTSEEPGAALVGLAIVGLMQLIASGLATALTVLLLFAISEGITLAIDVQRNTYDAAYRR